MIDADGFHGVVRPRRRGGDRAAGDLFRFILPMARGDRLGDVDRQEDRLAAQARGRRDRLRGDLAVDRPDRHEGVDGGILHHVADLVGGKLRHLDLVRIDAGFHQDDAQERDVHLGASDHADAVAGQIADRLDLRFGALARRALRRAARPQHHDVLAQDGDRLGAVGHLLIRARDREVGLLRGEHGDAVDGARGLHHGEPHGGALARKVLGQPLDQLQVAAVRGPDGDSQGGRPHDDEGGADRGGKQQQAGGEHQQRGTAVLAASGRNIVRRGQAV